MDDRLKQMMDEYTKNKNMQVSDYDADPYSGLVTPELQAEEDAVIEESRLAQEQAASIPNAGPQEDIIDEYQKRQAQIDEEMKDVKLQQQEHKLLGEKSTLGKLKVKNDADEGNEYSVAKELADTSINSYDENPADALTVDGKMYDEIPTPDTKIKTDIIEQKAGDAVKTREDGVLTPQEQMLEDYKNAKLQAENEAKGAGYVDMGANIARGLAQYGSTVAASEATRAGAKGVTGDLGFKPIDTLSKVEAKNVKKLNKLQDMISKLAKTKELKTKIVETDKGLQLVNMTSGKIINKVGDAKTQAKDSKDTLSRDGDSEISKQKLDQARKMYPGLTLPDGMSEYDIEHNKKDMISNSRIENYYKPKTEVSRINVDERIKERARKWMNDNQEDLKKQINDFNKDKIVMKSKESIAQMVKVREVLASNNPIGDNTISTFMSRGTGEVGALSEGDKKPFGGSKALIAQIKQLKESYANGKLTKENRKFLYKLTAVFEKADMRNIERVAQKRASQYGGIDFPAKVLVNKFMGIDDGYNDPDGIKAKYDFKPRYDKEQTSTKQKKTIVRKAHNKAANKTQYIYSDGTKEVVDGIL